MSTTTRKRKPSDEPRRPAEAAAEPDAPAAEEAPQAPQAVTVGEALKAADLIAEYLEVIAGVLKRPFRADQLGWKVQAESKDKTKCLVVPYIDARDVMNRLDEAVGIAGWRTSFHPQAEQNVLCRLELCLSGEWIPKEDVGGQSDQPDEGDRAKAAVSDALKRAAVHWGVGRYLYYLPQYWVAYDAERRKPKETPSLPHWALPPAKDAPRPTATVMIGGEHVALPAPQAPPPEPKPGEADPAAELKARDAELAHEGLCAAGALLAHVRAKVALGGKPWRDSYRTAREAATKFEHDLLERELDRLLGTKGEKLDRALAKLRVKPGTSPSTLDNAQLRQAIGWLRQMDDAAPEGNERRAS